MPERNLPELSPPDSGQATGGSPADSTAPLTAQKWLLEIERAEKDMQKYLQRARKIMKIYTEQNREDARTDRRYALLWANTEVLKPAVYARSPKPVVSRRFNDQDPTGRAVSEVLQRALTSTFERSDIDACLRDVRDDFLLVARGTAWVRYVPEFEPQQFDTDEGQTSIDVLTDETLAYDFVSWSDFIHPMARRWNELPWVGRRVYLDDATGIARFGNAKWQAIKDKQERPRDDQGRFLPKDKTLVYEIWSKRDDCIVWLARNSQDFLDKQPPLYNLKDFFPCPKPAYGTLPTDSLYPIPDYVYYQDQADEINELTNRIGALQDALKLTGFYPAGAEGDISTAIERALAPGGTNQMIPVPAWSSFTQGGGSKGMIEYLPIETVANVLKGCIDLRTQMINDVYQITGISDILRGATDASETATAQNLKAQWGGIRIRDRQEEMARFARDLARISAEIIAETFQPETIWRMVGLKYPTMAEQTLARQQYQMLQTPPQPAPPMPAPGAQLALPPPQVPGQQGPVAGPVNAPPPVAAPSPNQMQQLETIIDAPSQEAVMDLIRNDQVRSYRVDIETDSTVAADEQAEQEGRTKFAQVIGGLMAQSIPIIQAAPELTDTIGETILFVARAFRSGRELEESIEQAVDKIEARVANMMKQPPPPNPDVIRAQAEGQKAQIMAQTESQKVQLAAQTAAHQQQMELIKTRIDAAERMGKFQLAHAELQNRAESDARSHALAAAAHNKTMISNAYELASQNQADQVRDPTPLENLGNQFQQLAEMLISGQQSLQQGQQQLAQALMMIAGEQRQANTQQADALAALSQGYAGILAALQTPKKIVRGADGRAIGVEPARTLN